MTEQAADPVYLCNTYRRLSLGKSAPPPVKIDVDIVLVTKKLHLKCRARRGGCCHTYIRLRVLRLTSSASPPPVGRKVNPVTAEPPSSPSAQAIKTAVKETVDTVGGGHACGRTAGVRTE